MELPLEIISFPVPCEVATLVRKSDKNHQPAEKIFQTFFSDFIPVILYFSAMTIDLFDQRNLYRGIEKLY